MFRPCVVREGRDQERLATMFDLTFLGTSASVPSAERNHPGLLVVAGGKRILVDAARGPSASCCGVAPAFDDLTDSC
jgi:hypothetical protein